MIGGTMPRVGERNHDGIVVPPPAQTKEGTNGGKGIRQRQVAQKTMDGGMQSGGGGGTSSDTRPPTSGALQADRLLPPTIKLAPRESSENVAMASGGGGQGGAGHEILSSAGAHGAPSNGSNNDRAP